MLPLTLGECGVRPRTGMSEGERSVESEQRPDPEAEDGRELCETDDETRCACAGLTRGMGTAGVEDNVPHGGDEDCCSGIRYRSEERDGLLSRDRSCLSSTAPLTSFTTTTGMSASGVRGELIGLGLGLACQGLLLPVVTLAAPPSE